MSIVRWNLGLTLLALLLIGGSFALRLPGGAQNPLLDSAQFLVIWGYALVTPVLCALAWWRARKTHGASPRTNLMLFVIWLLAALASLFAHF